MKHESPQHTAEHQRWSTVRRGARALGYVAAAGAGGIGLTAASPTTVEIGNWYQAEARLSPTFVNEIVIETSINPITLQPEAPTLAPGITVLPHLQPTVIDSFVNNGNQLIGIEPTQNEIMDALESLAKEMGLKFAAGGLGAALIYGYLLNNPKSRKEHAKIGAGATAGLTAASLALAAGAYSTYNPTKQWAIETEGIFAEAYANRDLFKGISQKSSRVSSWVSAVLRLVNSIEAGDDTDTGDDEVKFLLVSDIHGIDVGPILREAVDQYGATAVIFAGDLLNYGTVGELEAAGIPESIEAIGVPFIFVTGNHDKTGPNDRDVLTRLAKVSNVILMQSDDDSYTTVALGGVTIGGFNDPRHSFDGQEASDVGEQEKAAGDFMAAVPFQELDIAVTHEHIATTPINKAANELHPLVTINGHGHRLDLHTIDNTINIEVGSATAGGLKNADRYNVKGKNIKDIVDPNLHSLDVLSFGTDCVAKQLTRVQYTIDVPRQVLTRSVPIEFANTGERERICIPSEPVRYNRYSYVDSASSPQSQQQLTQPGAAVLRGATP